MEQKTKFIEKVAHAEIAASTEYELDLNELRSSYGHNFNTFFLTNTDANSAVVVKADGEEIAFITSNNGSFAFDWEMGIQFNFISVTNQNAGAAIAANALKVFVGRTGHNGV